VALPSPGNGRGLLGDSTTKVGEGTGLQPLTEPRLLEIPALPFPAGGEGTAGNAGRAVFQPIRPTNCLIRARHADIVGI